MYILKEHGHDINIVIKKKDVLEDLLQNDKWKFDNVLPKGRRDNKLSIVLGLLIRDLRVFKIAREYSPDLMIGTSPEITHVGKLLKIPSIVANEDNIEAIPFFTKLTFPFASYVLNPSSVKVGKWEFKNISYPGFHELAYLHPKYFSPNISKVQNLMKANKDYFILRLSKLSAHHDTGIKGISSEMIYNIVEKLKPFGNVFISSERELNKELNQYLISINPNNIHHALYFAKIYIGDSQTMAAEAAVLGTPAIRFNDFVGRLAYLDELENKYELAFGFNTTDQQKLYEKLNYLLNIPNLKEEWAIKRKRMLSDKIDLTKFIIWIMENYPESVRVMKENPDYQYNFR